MLSEMGYKAISHLSACKLAAIATAVVSEPPLPKVVISPFSLIP